MLVALLLGAPTYFMGLLFVLWGRLALGEMYHVSTGFGVQLHAHHQLVTHGPYKYVRPPIYFGVGLAGVGGILLYRSRTLMFITALLSGLILRARREEQALAAEFGVDWDVYCRRVPAWFPRH